jgi:hypothetical protein
VIRSLRLVHCRIAENVLIVQTAREQRAKMEASKGYSMTPSRAEAEASHRISHWERYLRRPHGCVQKIEVAV